MRKLSILLAFAFLLCLVGTAAAQDVPHQMFLPAIPVNNGGCTPIVGDPPPATLIWVEDPYVTVDILSPCDPINHVMMRTFYQDATYPGGVWTRWTHISEANFTIYMHVLGRTQVWVQFTSLGPKPYSIETSTP